MARPKRGNYAYGPEGEARYKKNLREYLKKQKEAREKKTKIDSTKKNIDKQKTANKKATTTKTTKGTTTTKPKSTAEKGKSLATGKKPSKTKAVETPQTKTATKTRTTTRTQTKSKSTTTPSTKSKTTTKPATGSKTTTKSGTKTKVTGKSATKSKVTGKSAPKQQAPKNNQTLKVLKDGSKKLGKVAKDTTKSAVEGGKQIAGEVKKQVDSAQQTFKKSKAPRPTTPQQKAVSKVYRGAKRYGGKLLKKGGKELLKIGKNIIKNPKSATKGILGGIVAGKAAEGINYAVSKGINKVTGGAVEKGKKNLADRKKNPEKYERTLTGYRLKGTGSKKESSTTKNINKQKKANTTPNRGLKIKKTQYSSKNARKKQDFGAATGTKQADKRFATFREGDDANLKLQQERQKGNTETYSRKLSIKAKKQTAETKTNKGKKKKQSKYIRTSKGTLARRGTVTARRAENKERARKRAQELARKRRLANR